MKLLAAALAETGHAWVRYDKRDIGASAGVGPGGSALRFETSFGAVRDNWAVLPGTELFVATVIKFAMRARRQSPGVASAPSVAPHLQLGIAHAQMLKRARPGAVLAVVPGINYVLKRASAHFPQQTAPYSDPDFPLHPDLVERIAEFLHELRLGTGGWPAKTFSGGTAE